jgi:hypothetical protein
MTAPDGESRVMDREEFAASRHGAGDVSGIDGTKLAKALVHHPESYAMMIAALAVLGAMECRRKTGLGLYRQNPIEIAWVGRMPPIAVSHHRQKSADELSAAMAAERWQQAGFAPQARTE